ncbi:MAG: DUF362 domain-containing protein [Desulfatibacillaceae bacterium]
MQVSQAQRDLAAKFVFAGTFRETLVGDAMVALVAHAYTEEEASVVCGLNLVPRPAWAVARALKRPVEEVEPVLRSLADRLLILGAVVRGARLYGFMPLAPGVYEMQMIRSRTDTSRGVFYRRFAELFEQAYDEFFTWARPRIQGRDLRFGRIVPVEQSIDVRTGIMPHSTDRYSEIVDRNKVFALCNVCACRQEKELLGEGCGRGMDVCGAMGVLADLAVGKGIARRVSREEFVEAKARAAEQGLVNLVDNLRDPVQICSCCSCCCAALRIVAAYNIPTIIVQSRYEARVDTEACEGCGKCMKICPMDAISVRDGVARVDYARCIGCGLCVGKCDGPGALSMRERADHKPPQDNIFSYAQARWHEMRNTPASLLPRIGIGGALGRLLPMSISGPKYKEKDWFK